MKDDVIKYAIYNAIGVGKKNAVSRKELCQRVGCSDRVARKAIEELRHDRVIITDDDNKGYYIPTSDSTGKARAAYWIRRQENRIKSIKEALDGARRFVNGEDAEG